MKARLFIVELKSDKATWCFGTTARVQRTERCHLNMRFPRRFSTKVKTCFGKTNWLSRLVHVFANQNEGLTIGPSSLKELKLLCSTRSIAMQKCKIYALKFKLDVLNPLAQRASALQLNTPTSRAAICSSGRSQKGSFAHLRDPSS